MEVMAGTRHLLLLPLLAFLVVGLGIPRWGAARATAAAAAAAGSVSVQPFGQVAARPVVLVTLKRGPLSISITNWGAIITSLLLPDANGTLADVALGFNTFEEYRTGNSPYFGAIVGRVANRIANGTFVLDGVQYNLTRNEGNNTLHGGKIGFDKVLWKAKTKLDKKDGSPSATFTYNSFDGEQGFPGAVNVSVTYKLTGAMELEVEMRGLVGSKATPVNLAQHTYWNLGGHKSGPILHETIQIFGDKVTPTDENLIPTGQLVPVRGTPYDFFARASVIGSRIAQLQAGYDINYQLAKTGRHVIPRPGGRFLWPAATVLDPRSGRSMQLFTNQPGMQFYTANGLININGKDGAIYNAHDALCLETQGFPDAVHHPNFPSVIVQPHRIYRHTMLFRFATHAV